MSETLRVRIARILYGTISEPKTPFDNMHEDRKAAWLADADKVIADMGFERETNDQQHRYVTEWVANE